MNTIYNKLSRLGVIALFGLATVGCNDYLDITPPSDVTPETYFTTADQLGAYAIKYYNYYTKDDNTGNVSGSRWDNAFPHHGVGGSSYKSFFDDDQGTDNESGTNDRFFDGSSKVKVGNSGGSWGFGRINDLNYFLETVVPKYEAGQISGAEDLTKHYIGEVYMLRAIEYFGKLRSLGDFPIIRTTLPLDKEVLVDSSARKPRNLVARFILEDLDKAISLLSDGSATGGRTRITRDAAILFKARVALYEATFEKYFAGTPFVPDKSAGWPGARMAYNSSFSYDNDSEVNFFLDQALAASGDIAKRHPNLTVNNKKMIGAEMTGLPTNPYYDLFATQDPSGQDEALMYRVYNLDIGGGHCLNQYIKGGRGYTQEFANTFLMDNGLPIYAEGSGYAGDDFVADTKENRDWRWRLFMKAPGEYVYEGDKQRIGEGKKNKNDKELKFPALISGGVDFTTSTGYTKGKGWAKNSTWSKGGFDLTSAIIFRTAEAYLIYMEAAWEKYGDGLDADAWNYWGKLRTRAGLPSDVQVTIAATDLDKEEQTSHDFALYSGGKRITSKVLYNIRRERRCELMGEGLRWDDLIRWRALEQLKTNRYYKHGCKVFGPMLDWAKKSKLKYDQGDPDKNNVSSPSDVDGGFNGNPEYLSLLRVSSKNDWYNSGYTWRMAHYLDPIAEDHFLQTAQGGDYSTSPIYQNPYWGTTHDTPATE
ncbi:RagB/SusD family nutrient uptake outer membrane protein [Lepagella muris]|uniref:RagB/SusD family nutrient uptake outer membrane protein n=1 Tax=Lepagella muris TaxID=3032870 RepID=A0AC61RD99_9BACT|nr:RagB/SusD family nutrient uptake outer membrane protein [Lepagella muris]TGY77548.1 RagB/SusD family nutrient uptake outer membrane protein [Lepagella muris]THG50040.1 RagB/SusD family nutrient uptake outer membrane protein [Bacteroidales bacterium]TKC63190.1 RagB/SusD family nutrient uptake outer membrane protein [Bacteroidales bacterium]